jgi:hypothetical protein
MKENEEQQAFVVVAGGWVVDLERGLFTTKDAVVPIVTMKCRLVDRDGEVREAFDIPLDYPGALGLSRELLEAAEIANLHAKAEAGDEQARVELEEKAQHWDDDKLKRTYGFGPTPAV